MQNNPALNLALTIDVDPDANRTGGSGCVSAGFSGRVSLAAVRGGLAMLKDMLVPLSLPATIFWEARTLNALSATDPCTVSELCRCALFEHACHGFRHEDYTGRLSGVVPSGRSIRESLDKAVEIIAAKTGGRPYGFRAPHCNVDRRALNIIAGAGFRYDASVTVDAYSGGAVIPYAPAGIDPATAEKGPFLEAPLFLWRDGGGNPISGYLWQLLEGRRKAQDYRDMIAGIGASCPECLIQIAIHPWHIIIDENGNPFKDASRRRDELCSFLQSLGCDSGLKLTTIADYIDSLPPHCD